MFPELPMPKAGENVDKVQQYTDDFAETKKRLEEARQRRLDEKRKQEVAKKLQRSMSRENATETAAAMVEAERERRTRKSTTPPKQQKEDKTTPVKHRTMQKQEQQNKSATKKKLTMEDLEDDAGSDADWSDIETPNRYEFNSSVVDSPFSVMCRADRKSQVSAEDSAEDRATSVSRESSATE